MEDITDSEVMIHEGIFIQIVWTASKLEFSHVR